MITDRNTGPAPRTRTARHTPPDCRRGNQIPIFHSEADLPLEPWQRASPHATCRVRWQEHKNENAPPPVRVHRMPPKLVGVVSSRGMLRPVAPRAIVRRRGNPNWCRPCAPAPVLPTEFEIQLTELGLTKENCAESAQLRIWCQRNRNRCYVLEWLLSEWDIPVDPNFAA